MRRDLLKIVKRIVEIIKNYFDNQKIVSKEKPLIDMDRCVCKNVFTIRNNHTDFFFSTNRNVVIYGPDK